MLTTRTSAAAACTISAVALLVGSTVIVSPAAATTDAPEADPPVCRTSGHDHTCIFHSQPDLPAELQLRAWTVPDGVSEVRFEVRGGRGGNGAQGSGGRGGRVSGSLAVHAGQLFGIGVGTAADRSKPGLPDGGSPGTSERDPSVRAGAGGGSSVVGLADGTALFIAGGGGGGGAGVDFFGFGGGHGGDAGADGAKGFDLGTEGGYGGFAPDQQPGTSTFRFYGGGFGGAGCPAGDDGGVGAAGDGGDGGDGGYGGGGGGGGAGGSGGGGSGRACSDEPTGAPGVGGGGGGGSSYISSLIADGVTDLNPVSDAAVSVKYTIAVGTADSEAPDTFLTSTPALRDTRPTADRFSPRFTFEAVDDISVVGYECQLDGGAFAPCTSGDAVPVSAGDHTFSVRAVDARGNVDPTPAAYTWTVPEGVGVQLSVHPDQPNPTNAFGLMPDNKIHLVGLRASLDVEETTLTVQGLHSNPCVEVLQVNGAVNDLEMVYDVTGEEIEPGVWEVHLWIYGSSQSYGTHRIVLGEGCFRTSDGDPNLLSNEITITLDKAAPETTIGTLQETPPTGAPVTIHFGGSDVHSGVAGFECRLDGAAYSVCTSPIVYDDLAGGSHTFEVRAIDGAGNVDKTPASATFEINSPPTADAGADVTGPEGSAIELAGSVSDADPADAPTAAWNVTEGSPCSFADPTAATTTITCDYDGTFTATLTADDGTATASDSVTVTVTNAAPVIGTVTGPVDPVPVGTEISVSAPFADPGTDDTHACTIDWGDGTTTPPSPATSPCAGSHTYAGPGIYRVGVTVTDSDGAAGTASFEYVVVYDPDAGFVTGGGWIASPAGAYTPDDPVDPDLTGKATFGFVSKYKPGASVPDGGTQFRFHAASLDFTSTAYQWLVISGPKAQYKGTGTINGTGQYGFIVTANDGQQPGGGDVDRFRIKIWDIDTGTIVYDNQAGDPDDAAAHTAIQGGNIVINAKG